MAKFFALKFSLLKRGSLPLYGRFDCSLLFLEREKLGLIWIFEVHYRLQSISLGVWEVVWILAVSAVRHRLGPISALLLTWEVIQDKSLLVSNFLFI